MISPLRREEALDLTAEPLGPGWLRRFPTGPDSQEAPGSGVWRTGPQLRFRDELVAALDGATEIALLSSFLLAEDRLADAMLRAAERGVRLYVLTGSEQRIGKVVREDEVFEQRMAEQHKKLLDRLVGKVLLRSAEHIHAKFLVVDPQTPERARAWLSSANFNKALEDSVELGVALDPAGARALAACFQWAFWCEAERELRGPGRLMEIRRQHPATPSRPADSAVCATLQDGTALRDRVMALIHGARREILVASYGIGAEHPAVKALIEAANRGVRVVVLTRPRRAVAPGVAALTAAGISVLAHDKLHAKALCVDGQALVMTANLEAQGLDKGFDIGAVVSPDTACGVERTLREWADTFPWVYRADATRGDHLGDFCAAEATLRDGITRVTPSCTQSLPAVVAPDALHLEDAPTPTLKPSPAPGELPRLVKFTWEVLPPRLPKEATERLQEVEREEAGKDGKPRKVKARVSHDPRVFEHGGKTYVVLPWAEDIERARRLAADLGAKVVLP
ncbi:phospholipase D-like domain-containing protein [Sorangium sp. So ce429]